MDSSTVAALIELRDKGGWLLLLVAGIGYYLHKHPPEFIRWFQDFLAYRKEARMSDEQRIAAKMASLHEQEVLLTGVRNKMIDALTDEVRTVRKMVTDCHAESAEHRIQLARQEGTIGMLQQQNQNQATQIQSLMTTLSDLRKNLLVFEEMHKQHPELFNVNQAAAN